MAVTVGDAQRWIASDVSSVHEESHGERMPNPKVECRTLTTLRAGEEFGALRSSWAVHVPCTSTLPRAA
jgi:hypothetical protein